MFLMVSEKMNAMEEAKAYRSWWQPRTCNRKLPEDCRGERSAIVRPSERLIIQYYRMTFGPQQLGPRSLRSLHLGTRSLLPSSTIAIMPASLGQ
jgi:hypothetical protein